jgi:hypothetical protein
MASVGAPTLQQPSARRSGRHRLKIKVFAGGARTAATFVLQDVAPAPALTEVE